MVLGLCRFSLKIGMRSLGKVFHGSEETMRVVFFKEEIVK